jgi:hypothetical protein
MSTDRAHPALGRRPGSLVMIGSGIKAIGQFTLEAEAYVRWADEVYFMVHDPATANWIVERSARAVDLHELYDDDKPRATTYVQMAELMLRSVRQGRDVVGVFYGHPGFFVDASHRAVAIARREGYAASMLPGVSALDCLFADLGVDPCKPGCQILGATELLLRRRPMAIESHVVVLQVGMVGDLGFQFAAGANDKLPVLVRYLQDAYGDEHPVVHYIASEYPTVEPTIERFALSELLVSDGQSRVTWASTFYLPPKGLRPVDRGMVAALGLTSVPDVEAVTNPLPAAGPLYTRRDLEAVAELGTHRRPRGYRPARPSAELSRLLEDLALDPGLLERYDADPELVLGGRPGLSSVERAAVLSGDRRWLGFVMERSGREVARQLVERALSDVGLARRYHDLLGAGGEEDDIARGLRALGFDTTPAEVLRAFDELAGREPGFWASRYELVVEGRRGGTLSITPSEVLVDHVRIADHRFDGAVLSWSETSGNQSSAALRLSVLTGVDGRPLPAGAYLGPQVRGELWARGAPRPGRDNAFGKVGVYSPACIADPLGADAVETWTGAYATQLSTPRGMWRPGPVVEVRPAASGAPGIEVVVAGRPVDDVAYSGSTLSWAQAEPSYSGCVLLHREGESQAARFVGRLWQGSGQRSPTLNCVGLRKQDAARGRSGAVEAAVAAASRRSRAASLVAVAAVVRQGAAAGEAEARRLRAEAEAVLDQAFAGPATGDFGRLRALLTLGAVARVAGSSAD